MRSVSSTPGIEPRALRPVPRLHRRGIVFADAGGDGFAEDALVVGVVVVDVEVAGDLEVDGEDAQEGGKGGGAELGLPGVGAAHGGVDGAVAFGVGAGDVEEVGIAEQAAVGDDDPLRAPAGFGGAADELAAAVEGKAVLL